MQITRTQNLGEYYDLYVQSDTLLLADVFENFRNMCFKYMNFAPSLALKEIKVKLDLLTDIGMLLMEEKCIRGGICHSIYPYPKAGNKYMKDYD